MTTYVRGSNPVWFMVDLTSNHFDDTFYMFVLQNDLPYLPATVWHDPSGDVPWNQPIQFLANGTLPIDIFWDPDPDVVYRLEFRQGPTQSDPLIYLVENYTPGEGTGNITTFSLTTDNQITNPQFSLINFNSAYTITSGSTQDIDVAPGWVLELTGTGNVTLTKTPLIGSGDTINPSNAPYALRIALSGWSTAALRQRFQQNGMLWANKTVSSSITARIESASVGNVIGATLVASNATVLGTVLPITTALTTTFAEYTGYADLSDTTNTNVPPAAYIDYKLSLPTNCDLYVTSFQLVVGGVSGFKPTYEQTTIDRQIDQTFHNYRDSLLLQPKDSILTGWDFGLNPWQSTTTAATNLATFGYTADQTIMMQQAYVASAAGNNISIARGSLAQNYGLTVTAVTATNQFAMIQYIDPTTVRPYWTRILSSMVKLAALKQTAGNNMRVKMRLMYRASLPSALSQTEPIASWAALGEPVLAAGWTAVAPKNDPVYNLSNGANTLVFEGFTLPVSTNADMTLGIMIYTLDPMVQTGTADNIVFNRVSLVPNEYAIDCNPLSFDETLRRCEFYYQKSFPVTTVPAQNAGLSGAAFGIQVSDGATSGGPLVNYRVPMRAVTVFSTTLILYNPSAANGEIRNVGLSSNWSSSSATNISINGFTTEGTSPVGVGNFSAVHWSANARLGI